MVVFVVSVMVWYFLVDIGSVVDTELVVVVV